MNIFVLQVVTGKEKDTVLLLDKLNAGGRIVFPRRELIQKKKGRVYRKNQPLFPGYVFWERGIVDAAFINKVKKINNVIRFLPSSQEPKPLYAEEAQTLSIMLKGEGLTKLSPVVFDENNRIVVLEGPLKGMEGRIIKVDRRKKRMKVALDLYKNGYQIDFGYQDVGKK
jgi:transcriptional antiterminator NusG